MRVLYVEDRKALAKAVAKILEKNNYSVDMSFDGEDGLYQAQTGIYDFIILDIMLPKRDGISVLQEIRKSGIETPVILLTARGDLEDRVKGLDSGADDYLPKPFRVEELLARLRALGRRKGQLCADNLLHFGDIELNLQREIYEKLKEAYWAIIAYTPRVILRPGNSSELALLRGPGKYAGIQGNRYFTVLSGGLGEYAGIQR